MILRFIHGLLTMKGAKIRAFEKCADDPAIPDAHICAKAQSLIGQYPEDMKVIDSIRNVIASRHDGHPQLARQLILSLSNTVRPNSYIDHSLRAVWGQELLEKARKMASPGQITALCSEALAETASKDRLRMQAAHVFENYFMQGYLRLTFDRAVEFCDALEQDRPAWARNVTLPPQWQDLLAAPK